MLGAESAEEVASSGSRVTVSGTNNTGKWLTDDIGGSLVPKSALLLEGNPR